MPWAPMNRRSFLRAGSVAIALPMLDAMLPWGSGAKAESAAGTKRLLLVGRGLGFHGPYFFPAKPGPDYEAPRLLKPLADHRKDVTVFSGMSHLGYAGGHGTEVALFTGVGPQGMRQGDLRNTISLDQEVAGRLGGSTRFASLHLGGGNISWNRKGVGLPSESRATQVFKQLFIDGTPAEVAREVDRIKTGRSILDGVRDQAKALGNSLGPADRRRVDLLLSSIREAEQRLQQDQDWVLKPKPKVSVKPFTDDHTTDGKMLDRQRQWFELVRLALQTDSTRVIALWLWSHTERIDLPGLAISHHDASHHGQDDGKLNQLALIEEAEMKNFAEFLKGMKAIDEAGTHLLDRTAVLYAANLGNASAHTCDNLPILLAGGGFKHAGHVAFDRKNNEPMSNLLVRVLRQMGLPEVERFGSSTKVLDAV